MPCDRSQPSAIAAPAGLLKLIRCRVAAADRAAFAAGQQVWRGLREVAGFRGQTGGWSLNDPDLALILGFWRDAEAHQAFLGREHDVLYARSGQQPIIRELTTDRFRRLEGTGGSRPIENQAGRGGGFLRVIEIHLLPGRLEHLVAAQHAVWTPALEAAGGLAGGLWHHLDDPLRVLALSLWPSREAEAGWKTGPFFEAWRRAGVEDDCETVTGHLVPVEEDWRVDWPRP